MALDTHCAGVKSVRGIPLPCCVKCQRRIYPQGQVIRMAKFTPEQIQREWRCEGRIAYEG
jgi:hypothetical protein